MNGPERSNIELKARFAGYQKARLVAEQISERSGEVLHQVDTYFHAQHGRLKLRVIDQQSAELIWYCRPDHEDASTSRYNIVPVPDWKLLRETMAGALGIDCEVVKRRELFLWENVRIHLDQVEELGSFIEFEAVLAGEIDSSRGHQQLSFLRRQFRIAKADLVAQSYSDLIRRLDR